VENKPDDPSVVVVDVLVGAAVNAKGTGAGGCGGDPPPPPQAAKVARYPRTIATRFQWTWRLIVVPYCTGFRAPLFESSQPSHHLSTEVRCPQKLGGDGAHDGLLLCCFVALLLFLGRRSGGTLHFKLYAVSPIEKW
jgi:hypothetical protein